MVGILYKGYLPCHFFIGVINIMEVFTYTADAYRTIQQSSKVEYSSTIKLTDAQIKEALEKELDELDHNSWATIEIDDTTVNNIKTTKEFV
jgi:hypothetical protein